MQLEVPRMDLGKSATEEFFRRYLEQEYPVILTGFTDHTDDPGLLERIWQAADDGHAANSHHDVALSTNVELPLPEIVRTTLERGDVVHRERPVRLWMQPPGQITSLHYDGNSLCGFNWHLYGRKEWLLIAPTRLLPMLPLTFLSMAGDDFEPDPQRYDVMRVVVEPGEMLYVPRYWAHRVKALGPDLNANLNWVWTKREPNLNSPVGRREASTLWIRKRIGRLNKLIVPRVAVNDYGNGGRQMYDNYTTALKPGHLLKGVAVELRNCLMYPFRGAAVRRSQARSRQNNFPAVLRPPAS